MAVAHYLDALAWQRDVARLHAIFGGKSPHPNFLVGGELNFLLNPADGVVQMVVFLKHLAEFVVAQAQVPDGFAMFGEFT